MKAPGFISAVAGIALAIASVAPFTAHAGIKYWDNPAYRAFDVDCYVPGAVWHYDGIRNAGATEEHSTTTTTWKNLGSSGANNDVWVRYLNQAGNGWGNSSAPSSLGTVGGKNLGSWTEKGFTFTGDSELRSTGSISSGTSYTIQMLVDGAISGQTRAKPYLMSVQQNNFAFYVDRSNSKLCWGVENSSASDDPFISGDTLGYVTAILNGTDKTAAFFSGTKIPTDGNGFQQFSSVSGKSDSGYCICGYTGTDGLFKGTMYSYRYYTRVLTEEEVAWNRVVDEQRFFGRKAPLPVTNVEVATAVAGADGAEPAGCYAVDGRHTFIAPATTNVNGTAYVCTGYTLEARSGEGWSDPVFHKAALYQPCACVVTEGECVRLTWQWAKAAGLKNLGYTVEDYVWDGLETFYDGICNQGTNVAHSYTATNWVNLGSIGYTNDVFVQRLKLDRSGWVDVPDLNTKEVNDPGYWTENGFTMKGTSRFRCNDPGNFTVGKNYSLQMLIDAKASDQVTANSYPLGAEYQKFAFQLRKSDGTLFWKYESSKQPTSWAYMTGGVYDYMTAIARDNNTQRFFDGTTEPTSGTGSWDNDSVDYTGTGFCLGGYGKTKVDDLFVGTFKNFRQYDHALTSAEVAQNRKVDDWRYFGIPDNPNVVVQSTVPYLRGEEPDGSYAVDGSHVFTAPASVTAKGITYECDGYTVEEWDGSTWTNATSYESCSYTYNTSSGLVRLTWRWKATHGLRTAADYSFDDYSQAGLVWNYDGIRNRGYKDSDHDSSASTWKNLGSGGSQFDLSWKSGTTTTGSWADDGYVFRDGPRFWCGAHVGPVKSFTLQTLIDADIASQPAHTHSYIMSVKTDSFNMSLVSPTYNGSASNSICWYAQGGMMMYFHTKDLHYTFATAMMDFESKTAMMFPGTEIPTEYVEYGPYGKQRLFHQYTSVNAIEDSGYGLGNANNANANGMNGKIKSFRYYDRVLTEEEIVRNRNVDAVRYFGELGVTNVYVVAGGGTQAETGAYKVEGEWAFTAENIVKDSVTKNVAAYYTEELVNGAWTNKTRHEGATYTYTEGTSPSTVRLTWASQPEAFIMTVR